MIEKYLTPRCLCSLMAITVVAGAVTFSRGAVSSGRLLTPLEKEKVLAADGGTSTSCYYIYGFPCAALSGTSGNPSDLTACGGSSAPNCSGDCTNACASSTASCWSCKSATNAGYANCPTFKKDISATCGNQYTGAQCSGANGSCYCINGTATTKACGGLNDQPKNLGQVCPPPPS